MDSSTTSKLTSRNRPRGYGQDRISQLPDPIIHHIFRFLPIREAVQSGVLAKRWTNLWASMQWLELNRFEFCENEEFERFIDAVLMLRKPLNVDTFCLNWDTDFDEPHANMWIVYAINHNVRVLQLCIDTLEDYYLDLPNCLITYHSLEELCVYLEKREKISRLSFAEFSRLKRLHFSAVIFIYNDLRKLISGCPLIEDLRLDYCDITNDYSPCLYRPCLFISSKTMKTLRIRHCDIQSMIQFCIPSLISLHYECSSVARASFVNLSSLVHAFISARYEDGSIEPRRVVDLIYEVSNAKILKLCGTRIEFISDKEVPELPTFPNLERLTIGSCCMGNNFKAVAYFLQHSPNLEYLTLKRPIGPNSSTEVSQSARSLSFDCPRLKIIEIRCSKTNERVLDFVKTLLANAKALHKIIIIPDQNWSS